MGGHCERRGVEAAEDHIDGPATGQKPQRQAFEPHDLAVCFLKPTGPAPRLALVGHRAVEIGQAESRVRLLFQVIQIAFGGIALG